MTYDKQAGSSTPPFSTYYQFWGAAAHCPRMYYSFDLGGWHFISLDSINYVNGGIPLFGESKKFPGPPSAKFHAKAQHVGFFTLYVDGGYRYTIDAVAHGGTTTVVDAGAGNLLGGAVPHQGS